MELSKLEPSFGLKIGFREEDIKEINKIINILYDKNLIKLNTLDFDLSSFIKASLIKLDIRKEIILNSIDLDKILAALKDEVVISSSYSYLVFLLCLLKLDYNYDTYKEELITFYLTTYLNRKRYFNTILDGFVKLTLLRKEGFNKSSYDLLKKATTLERSGWVYKKMEGVHLETIAEHMYNMALLASLYLDPDSKKYSLSRVNNMVLIHDLAETVTGDIPNPKKTSHDDFYEDLVMRSIITLVMIEHGKIGLSLEDIWNEWYLYETYSSKLAHDLDVIELFDKLFYYKEASPRSFSDEETKKWLNRKILTLEGKNILKAIQPNNKFIEELLKNE